LVIPVNKYRQVVRPNNGINDHCFTNANRASMIQMIQKIIVETFNVVLDPSLAADSDLISPTLIAESFLPRAFVRFESGSSPISPLKIL